MSEKPGELSEAAEPPVSFSERKLKGLEQLADDLAHSAYGADRNKAPHMKEAVAHIRALQAVLAARETA